MQSLGHPVNILGWALKRVLMAVPRRGNAAQNGGLKEDKAPDMSGRRPSDFVGLTTML